MKLRKEILLDYFFQFANSRSDRTIDIDRMRRLLPRIPQKKYDDEYIDRTQHINVPWIMKGIKKY
eukprot:CAMPEP_0168313526 /NCGR_PEP_ID=MMETSP0210-20121227/2505_1 /TAXON_ID=40633 /ORGANISM="Condylostoma magnum, Strain COL2" /LENGTH=64 /DNA_ID=CAMNT_0008271123 /DNA_START=3005 /DNA_END=3199 /DNA_ORIENTATION=-